MLIQSDRLARSQNQSREQLSHVAHLKGNISYELFFLEVSE